MGLLEIHFHDSELLFRPSMRIGPSTTDAASEDEPPANPDDDDETSAEMRDELRFPLDETTQSRKRGLIVAILVVTFLILVRKMLEDREMR